MVRFLFLVSALLCGTLVQACSDEARVINLATQQAIISKIQQDATANSSRIQHNLSIYNRYTSMVAMLGSKDSLGIAINDKLEDTFIATLTPPVILL